MESTVGTGIEVLRTIAGNMRGIGIPGYYHLGTRSQIVLVLCPEHANDPVKPTPTSNSINMGTHHYDWVFR